MADYSLVPVEHQPDFENVALVPVDHDPFSADGITQQAQSTPAQSQLAQPPPPQPATGVGRLYVGPAYRNAQASEADDSWDPEAGSSDTSRLDRSAASTLAQDKPAPEWSHFNQPFGELKPATSTPTQQIGHLAADALTTLGMQPYTAKNLATGIGNVLGLTPLGFAGSALDLIDAKRRNELQGVITAATGLIPGAKVRLSPAAWAAKKGYAGVGTTANGGPTFAATEHLYRAAEEQRSVVKIKLTGSRREDIKRANEEGRFTATPADYIWHHVDDFDSQSGEASLELIHKRAHNVAVPHTGSVGQYEKHNGIKYKR